MACPGNSRSKPTHNANVTARNNPRLMPNANTGILGVCVIGKGVPERLRVLGAMERSDMAGLQFLGWLLGLRANVLLGRRFEHLTAFAGTEIVDHAVVHA